MIALLITEFCIPYLISSSIFKVGSVKHKTSVSLSGIIWWIQKDHLFDAWWSCDSNYFYLILKSVPWTTVSWNSLQNYEAWKGRSVLIGYYDLKSQHKLLSHIESLDIKWWRYDLKMAKEEKIQLRCQKWLSGTSV